jgi:hypothetical protein
VSVTPQTRALSISPCSSGEEYRPTPAGPYFQMLARRGVWQAHALIAGPEVSQRLTCVRDMLSGHVGAVVTRDMARAGVSILAGCHSMTAGFCVHDELAAMIPRGMTPLIAAGRESPDGHHERWTYSGRGTRGPVPGQARAGHAARASRLSLSLRRRPTCDSRFDVSCSSCARSLSRG